MSTPTNQQAGKEQKPTPRPGQASAKAKTTPAKNTAGAAQPARAAQRPAQSAAKPAQAPAKTPSQALPKSNVAPTPKAPPAPKPRDPSVARRDERREERRLEIQARQQERRQELRQAKQQKLLIRYDLIIAPILLIALVAVFLVLHEPIVALVGGLVIVFAAFTVLAYATLPMSGSKRLARPKSPALGEAAVVESTLNDDAPPPASQASDEADENTASS
jgi:hypothetical protein